MPFTWLDGGVPIGYGEIWEDREADEAELARLIVEPSARGRGEGRRLTRALADEARRRRFAEVWLRAVPDNVPAIRAYEAAGFVRAAPDEEAGFNAAQPRAYAWLRDSAVD